MHCDHPLGTGDTEGGMHYNIRTIFLAKTNELHGGLTQTLRLSCTDPARWHWRAPPACKHTCLKALTNFMNSYFWAQITRTFQAARGPCPVTSATVVHVPAPKNFRILQKTSAHFSPQNRKLPTTPTVRPQPPPPARQAQPSASQFDTFFQTNRGAQAAPALHILRFASQSPEISH